MDGSRKEAVPVLQVYSESAGGGCLERCSESLGGHVPDPVFANHRLNINDFTDFPQFGTVFEPIPGDINLWNSTNPLGSIIEIDIPVDDGAVVCSDYNSCCWIFSTVKDPVLFNNLGSHPINGSRQFGIAENGGNKYFYNKGCERANNIISKIFGYFPQDALWSGMLDNFKGWINDAAQGGQAGIMGVTTQRPSWNSVQQILMSSSPITTIPCE